MKNILIVEDELLIALKHELMVKKLGHKVLGKVCSGKEAVSFVKQHEPDLILMDIRLGDELNGIETVAQINKKRNIPVVYISASSEALKDEELDKDYFLGFLTKPITLSDMDNFFGQLVENE